MWHTSRGDRTLFGDEAALICRAIDEMVSALVMHVHDDFEESASDCDSGIAIFDSCTPSQRIALLHQVASFLINETKHALPLNALVDATVAAIFAEIRDQVAIEIGFGVQRNQSAADEADAVSSVGLSWREMVLAVHLDCFDQKHELEEFDADGWVPDVDCDQLPLWEVLIHDLSELILWDRDFEMAESFLDLDPSVSGHRRRLLGIDEHYFIVVPNDPDSATVFEMVQQTRQLVKSKPR